MRISVADEATDGEALSILKVSLATHMVLNMKKVLTKCLGDLPSSWIGRVAYGLFLLAVLAVLIRSVVMMLVPSFTPAAAPSNADIAPTPAAPMSLPC